MCVVLFIHRNTLDKSRFSGLLTLSVSGTLAYKWDITNMKHITKVEMNITQRHVK